MTMETLGYAFRMVGEENKVVSIMTEEQVRDFAELMGLQKGTVDCYKDNALTRTVSLGGFLWPTWHGCDNLSELRAPSNHQMIVSVRKELKRDKTADKAADMAAN